MLKFVTFLVACQIPRVTRKVGTMFESRMKTEQILATSYARSQRFRTQIFSNVGAKSLHLLNLGWRTIQHF